jgi:hypothetical protein
MGPFLPNEGKYVWKRSPARAHSLLGSLRAVLVGFLEGAG